MQARSSIRRLLAVSFGLAFAASPATLLASGFQLVEQSGSGLGNAYAGQAAAVKDASAVFFNPANLTFLPGSQLVLSVNPIGIRTDFVDSGSTRPYLPTSPPFVFPVPLGGEGGDAGGWTPIPSVYLSVQTGEYGWFGLGVSVPFGLKTEWEADWAGRFHAVKSDVETINVNPTLAMKVSDNFSIGAGLSYQKIKATLTQAVPYGSVSYLGAVGAGGPAAGAAILGQLGGPAGLALEGISQVEGDTWSWGWNVGATINFGERGHLAGTYRSRIEHTIEGDAVFADKPSFSESGPVGAIGAALNATFADGPVTTLVELPETWSVALVFGSEKLEVMADYTFTGWSSIQVLAIEREAGTLSSVPLNFDDTFRVGLGLNLQVTDDLKLRLGTAYDETPVQDMYRTPRLPDQKRTWAAAGFQFRLGAKATLDLGYAHLFIDDASSDLPNQSEPGASPAGDLVGSYTAKVDILAVQLGFTF